MTNAAFTVKNELHIRAKGTALLPAIAQPDDSNTGIYWRDSDSLGFSTNGAERMYIGADGNVSIVGVLTVNSVNGTTASFSGNVTAPGFNGTITKSVTDSSATDLVYGSMATNDYFRIRIGGTGHNRGYVEIATADDAEEPIYVRQYSGLFSSLVRTATILDGGGNTSFPGTVSAPRFAGPADTALVAGTADKVTGRKIHAFAGSSSPGGTFNAFPTAFASAPIVTATYSSSLPSQSTGRLWISIQANGVIVYGESAQVNIIAIGA